MRDETGVASLVQESIGVEASAQVDSDDGEHNIASFLTLAGVNIAEGRSLAKVTGDRTTEQCGVILTTEVAPCLGLLTLELSLLPRTGIYLATPGQTAATELVLLESINPGGLVHVPEVLAVGDLLAGDQAVPPLPDMTAVTDWTGSVLILLLPDSIILFICRLSA